ncbi:hypothetical protein NA56DRAFT_134445 [Hyaloscypha hepaticicola]|uniref:Uncharacterized protein n=1 Tax=Hyaloscypha hepaticicola TaxID=2082293 RepID=A0A2J6Q4K9_9HELO|nr:hypothetical protein NA56DRAFT_134445 [Hyaloscypha hepaticicola]
MPLQPLVTLRHHLHHTTCTRLSLRNNMSKRVLQQPIRRMVPLMRRPMLHTGIHLLAMTPARMPQARRHMLSPARQLREGMVPGLMAKATSGIMVASIAMAGEMARANLSQMFTTAVAPAKVVLAPGVHLTTLGLVPMITIHPRDTSIWIHLLRIHSGAILNLKCPLRVVVESPAVRESAELALRNMKIYLRTSTTIFTRNR